MRYYFQAIPIPMSGVMLAFVSLANLFHTLGATLPAHISFFIGVVLFLSLIGKLVFATKTVVAEMQNPIIASVSPTFTMGTLSLSSGLANYGVHSAVIHTLWVLAAVTQIFIICYFIKAFIWKKGINIANIFPSWLILFVGVAVMPLTAGDLSGRFTQGILILAICAFIIIVPIVILRGFIRKDLPEPTIPMLGILTAPASLCLAAYIVQFNSSSTVIVALYTVAQLLFFLLLTKLPSMLKLPFYPSYAALTFPLVITATATNAFMHAFQFEGTINTVLMAYFALQLLLAICIVVYVLTRYVNYLSVQVKQKRQLAQQNKQTTA